MAGDEASEHWCVQFRKDPQILQVVFSLPVYSALQWPGKGNPEKIKICILEYKRLIMCFPFSLVRPFVGNRSQLVAIG